ncbi:hypothetical protein ACSVGF_28845, partial [Klebsiella pneumoniae]|uniref:hypothetical protein n=1 Tax=Klebsiella pneumoniae TaxID=573 RepID=UPI003F630E6F
IIQSLTRANGFISPCRLLQRLRFSESVSQNRILVLFFEQKTALQMVKSLVGSDIGISDRGLIR